MDYLQIANSWQMWLAVIPVALVELYQAYRFTILSREAGPIAGLSKEEANQAFKVGMRAAIGPALSVFAVMLGLMAVIGAPLAWQRLSIIGAAPTELAAATMAAKAQGIELGAPNYGAINFANASWVMALNGGAWLASSALLGDKLDKLNKRFIGSDTKKLGILSVAAMCGAFGYMAINEVLKGVDPAMREYTAAAVSAFLSMLIFEKLAKKYPALGEWTLALGMIVGMVGAIVYKRLVMGV